MFSGIKDIDLLILDKLSDKELVKIPCINIYSYNLCNNETFWLNRFIKNYGKHALQYKSCETTWKKYYLKIAKMYDY